MEEDSTDDPRPKGQGGKGASPLLHRLGGWTWRLPISRDNGRAWSDVRRIGLQHTTRLDGRHGMAREGGSRTCVPVERVGADHRRALCERASEAMGGQPQRTPRITHGGTATADGRMEMADSEMS